MPKYYSLEQIKSAVKITHEKYGGMSAEFDIYKLMQMPTADVVEVVRCKYCKYMTERYDTDGNAPYWTCSEWDSGTDYDGFCHYAERRTE